MFSKYSSRRFLLFDIFTVNSGDQESLIFCA
jgi:hypothetical protein